MTRLRASTQINASGTPSATTFLRGDDTWAVPAGASGSSTRVYRTTSLSITDSTWTAIGFNNETRDELSAHDNSTNNDRVTLGATGRYRITGQAGVDNCKAMGLRVMVNGGAGTRKAVVITATTSTAGEVIQQISTGTVDLTSGDYVQLWVIAFAGVSMGLDGPAEDTVWFEVERVS